jgi:uncharacterized protein (TIGR03382 family)
MQRFAQRRSVGSLFLIAAITLPALAEPVVFDNSAGEFDWGYYQLGNIFSGDPTLDITRAPDDQSNPGTKTWIQRRNNPGWTSADPHDSTVEAWTGSAIAYRESVVLDHYGDWGWPSKHTHHLAKVFQPGDVIGPDAMYEDSITVNASVKNLSGDYVFYDFWNNAEGYLGIRLTIAGKTHYGWMQVDKYCYKAISWAYETSPNTPIAVPIPAGGTLPAIVLGVGCVMRRRR